MAKPTEEQLVKRLLYILNRVELNYRRDARYELIPLINQYRPGFQSIPEAALFYTDKWQGIEDIEGFGKCHVFEFVPCRPDDELSQKLTQQAVDRFIECCGGAYHPLGGFRTILNV